MMISHKNLRKIAEIMRIFLEIFLKICPKKMYTLIRYAGNMPARIRARKQEEATTMPSGLRRG